MSLDTVLSHSIPLRHPGGPRADGCALVLMGGGARTAYQAGVLKAVAAMLPEGGAAFPFRWLFGTSAGALNASFLACRADDGAAALPALGEFWLKLRSDQVYRLEAPTWCAPVACSRVGRWRARSSATAPCSTPCRW